MYIFATVTIFTVVMDFLLADKPKDQSSSVTQTLPIVTPPLLTETPTPRLSEYNPVLNSMWVYRPNSHQALDAEDFVQNRVVIRPGSSVTRLAKTLAYGFNPYFQKAYFEPFEKRPKPIKLVAFKKNGITPRESINVVAPGQVPDIAELQSPFNDVGSYWLEDTIRQP